AEVLEHLLLRVERHLAHLAAVAKSDTTLRRRQRPGVRKCLFLLLLLLVHLGLLFLFPLLLLVQLPSYSPLALLRLPLLVLPQRQDSLLSPPEVNLFVGRFLL